MRYTIAIGKNSYNYRRKTEMAKRKEAKSTRNRRQRGSAGSKMQAMREAQRKFATFTQEQVDKIFTRRLWRLTNSVSPCKMAVEETRRGIVEDKIIKNHYAAEYIYNAYKSTKTCGVIEEDPAYGIKRLPNQSAWWRTLFRRQTQPRLQFQNPHLS